MVRWTLIPFLLGSLCTGAEIRDLLRDQPAPLALLARNPIHVHVTGQVDAEFDRAAAMFMDEKVLDDVQAEYARQLPPGETAEFVVHQTAVGHYSYVNRDGQHSEVRELYKAKGTDGASDSPGSALTLSRSGLRCTPRSSDSAAAGRGPRCERARLVRRAA